MANENNVWIVMDIQNIVLSVIVPQLAQVSSKNEMLWSSST